MRSAKFLVALLVGLSIAQAEELPRLDLPAPADSLDYIGGTITLDTRKLKEEFALILHAPEVTQIFIKRGEPGVSVRLACVLRETSRDCKVFQGVVVYQAIAYKLSEAFVLTNPELWKKELAKEAARHHRYASNAYVNEWLSTLAYPLGAGYILFESGGFKIVLAIPVILVGSAAAIPVDLVKAPLVGVKRLLKKKTQTKNIQILFTEDIERLVDPKQFRGVLSSLAWAAGESGASTGTEN